MIESGAWIEVAYKHLQDRSGTRLWMTDIRNRHLVEEALGRWRPCDLAFIESLSYVSGEEGTRSKLDIVALFQRRDEAKEPSKAAGTARVAIRFEGVSNLNVKSFGPFPKQVVGFDITDVSDRGWERIRFAVEDYENGDISLNCEDVTILSCECIADLNASER